MTSVRHTAAVPGANETLFVPFPRYFVRHDGSRRTYVQLTDGRSAPIWSRVTQGPELGDRSLRTYYYCRHIVRALSSAEHKTSTGYCLYCLSTPSILYSLWTIYNVQCRVLQVSPLQNPKFWFERVRSRVSSIILLTSFL